MQSALIPTLATAALAVVLLLALSGCCCPQKACCQATPRCGPAAAALPDGPYAKDRKQSAWAYLTGKYDANGDGKISAKEHGRGERAFKNLDRNGDGSITPDELGPGPIHGLMARMLAMLWFQDDDKPMVLSREESRVGSKRWMPTRAVRSPARNSQSGCGRRSRTSPPSRRLRPGWIHSSR